MKGIEYKSSEFRTYKKKVQYRTELIRKEIYESWNGLDHYDGEFIKENLKLHYNHSDYPTIDHKISCFFGFINNIPVEEIAKSDNLCITKRKLNAKKSNLTESEFVEKNILI